MALPLRLLQLATAATLVALFSCASGPKPTTVKATLEVQPTVNPDSRGRPSPVVVRVYALKSLGAFNGAGFFPLFEKDKETLGAELVDSEEFQLLPGEKRELSKEFKPEARYLGVFAAFRDTERAQWRASIAIPPQKVFPVQIRLESNKVSIAAGN